MLVYEGNKSAVREGWDATGIVKETRNNHSNLEQNLHVFGGFKRLLYDGLAGSLFEERLAVLSKSIEDVVADYLAELVQLTKHHMEHCGYRQGDLVQFIYTVPAIWTDRAKQAIMVSAQTAMDNCDFSNGSISLCSESMAAAAYVFQVNKSVDLEVSEPNCLC